MTKIKILGAVKEKKPEDKKPNTIVIKDNTGSLGENVFKIDEEIELENKIFYFKDMNLDFVINPFEDIHCEIRIFVVNGEIKLKYKKFIEIPKDIEVLEPSFIKECCKEDCWK